MLFFFSGSQLRGTTSWASEQTSESQLCCVTTVLGTSRLSSGSLPSPEPHLLWPCSPWARQTFAPCLSSPARIQASSEELVRKGIQKKRCHFHATVKFFKNERISRSNFKILSRSPEEEILNSDKRLDFLFFSWKYTLFFNLLHLWLLPVQCRDRQ